MFFCQHSITQRGKNRFNKRTNKSSFGKGGERIELLVYIAAPFVTSEDGRASWPCGVYTVTKEQDRLSKE